METQERGKLWTLVLVSAGLFMVVLDNLVVNVALPSIHNDFGASVQALEWTVNAYVLAYGVLLLTGAALGDRFGRRRMFVAGISLFTAASAGAALAPSADLLIAARAVQGVGAAIVTPLTLTLLASAFPPERRGVALGVWSGISGVAVAIGPLVGGAVIELADWHWIFWINVPIGLVLAPLAARRLEESYGPTAPLDLPGLALASTGLFGLVYGLVRAQTIGWTAPEVLISLGAGLVLLAAFVRQELRSRVADAADAFFAKRSFAVTNVVSMAMYFGMFGSIFFLSQFMQNVLGNSPLEAGLKLLVWTGATMVVAPIAGVFSRKIRPASGSWSPASRCRPTALGLAGDRRQHHGRLRDDDPRLRRRRRRDGAGLRPLGERHPQLGPGRPGGPGVRRHQRDPRARRHLRHRRPRHRVQRRRRLHLAAGVRRRHGPRAVGRGRGARLRRPGRRGCCRSAAGRRPRRSRNSRRPRPPRSPAPRNPSPPRTRIERWRRDTKTEPRRRVPAAERRDALIEAAVHHFAHGGLQGTKVSAIAAEVGVAQPYVFSLFPTKRDLFLAAVGRCFEKIASALRSGRGGVRGPRAGRTGRRRAEGDRQGLHRLARRQPRPAAAPAPGLRRLRRRRGDPELACASNTRAWSN